MFWLCLLFLARSARFVLLGGMCIPFSVIHGLCCLSETWVDTVLKETLLPTDCPVLYRCWDDYVSSLYCTIMFSMSWKCKSFIGVCACCYNRSLIFVLCFAISVREHIPSSFLWFVNMRSQSSCLLVTTFSLHHCIWDCHPDLPLTSFASYWLLS
jgi:hypothetical protein